MQRLLLSPVGPFGNPSLLLSMPVKAQLHVARSGINTLSDLHQQPMEINADIDPQLLSRFSANQAIQDVLLENYVDRIKYKYRKLSFSKRGVEIVK